MGPKQRIPGSRPQLEDHDCVNTGQRGNTHEESSDEPNESIFFWAAEDVEGSYRGVRTAPGSCGESARWGKGGSVAFGMTDENNQDENRNWDGNKYNNDRR